MTTPTQNPGDVINDLSEFISRRMRDVSANLNSCLVGTITAINANGTITCSVNFQKVLKGIVALDSGLMGDQIVDYPALVNVPVFVYQGGGAYIQMPIQATVYNEDGTVKTPGDSCLLLFCDRDMDIWFETGQIAPPNSDRVHNINDAIAIVGINTLAKTLPANTSGIILTVDQTGERLCQSGMMSAYGGSTAPNGWLLCDGSSYAKTTYPLLFAAIGYTYGGSGANFSVPNMAGQVAVGIGGSLGLTLGQEFGEVNHHLTIPELPSHTHTDGYFDSINAGSGSRSEMAWASYGGGANSTGATGSDTPHNNVQPSLGFNFIIKI